MQGYTVLKGYDAKLIEHHLRVLKPDIDFPAERSNKFTFIEHDPVRFTEVLDWGDVPLLIRTFCGNHARLDNHFGFNWPAPAARKNIHGGPYSESRSCYYSRQGDVMQTSNLKIGIALHAQAGLALIPGSHTTSMRANGGNHDPDELVVPYLNPGDVIVFTDALVHGTVDAPGERTMLYYTITPGHVCWAQYTEPMWLNALPPERRKLIRPPGIARLHGEGDQRRVLLAAPTYEVTKK